MVLVGYGFEFKKALCEAMRQEVQIIHIQVQMQKNGWSKQTNREGIEFQKENLNCDRGESGDYHPKKLLGHCIATEPD